MKTLLALLFFLSITATAENPKINEIHLPITCYPLDTFLTSISETFQESLAFISESKNDIDEPLFHQLWINHETQTWTFLVINAPRKTACLIASGKGFNNWGPSI